MTRKEREANPEESFDGGYHLYAKQMHKERVAKNPDRIEYAIKQFEKHGIEYELKNAQTGHFHCYESLMISCFSSMQEQERFKDLTMCVESMR